MEAFNHVCQLISPKLTWEIFEKVLKKQHNSTSVKLIQVILGKPGKMGDANLSTIVRFSVEYADENCQGENYKLHVISKSLVKNICQQKSLRNTDFCSNEVRFYEYVWPELDAFQRKMKCPNIFKSIPKYLHGFYDGKNDYVLLEDLSFQNYEGFTRSDALTLDRAKMVLKILAQFHALGYTFKRTEPDLFEKAASKLKEAYFHEDYRSWYIGFHNKLKAITLDAVQKELPEEYIKKFEEIMSRDIFKETTVLCSPNAPTKFKTITHGDTWMPNFLTRFDSEKHPEHSIMLDFQLSRHASLAQDFSFFIYACTDAELRATKYEEMMKFYCQEFNEFVGKLNPQLLESEGGIVLSYDDFIEELKMNGSFTLCMSMEAGIASMIDDEDFVDLGDFQSEECVPLEVLWNAQLLKTKEKRQKLVKIIKHIIDNKYV